MTIKSVEFAGAVAQPGGAAPGRLPEIAFSGRSNVGKSSLINMLLGRTRTQMARVSTRPGKTQEINFYRVRAALDRAPSSSEASGATGFRDIDFFLVDLPGYGYARVPERIRERWRPLIESYLSTSQKLRGVIQLIDARHDPSTDDRRMVEYLATLGVPTLFALTKIDKLGRGERRRRTSRMVEVLDVDADQVIPFSARTGEGRELLLDSVGELLGAHEEAV